ncbi:MAG: M28 family peptidase [Fimbriiglobus sp.]
MLGRRWVGICLLLLMGPMLLAQETKQDEVLLRMKKDIFFLAGEECEGRGTETKGIIKAGEYIAESFKQSGLKPAGTQGYFQPFGIATRPRLEGDNRFSTKNPSGEKLEVVLDRDYRPLGQSATGKFSGEFVFVGYGIQAKKLKDKEKEFEYDDYAGVDVKGKIAVILRRSPLADDDKKNPFKADNEAQHEALVTKITLAEKMGAAGVVLINDATYGKGADELMPFRGGSETSKIPVLHAKREFLDKMLVSEGSSLKEIEKDIDKELKPKSVELKGWSMQTEVSINRGMIPARNVVGVVEGNGPLANETIVIGAHYDHLGYGENGSLGGAAGKGKLHYGADDNGSGTTGLLEMARRFGAIKNREGRRIVFIAFAGEERGLFGSIHYCKEPTFPLDKTVFMLNFDMIGRVIEVKDDKDGDKLKDRVVIYGTGTSEGMEKFVDETNKKYNFKALKIPGGTGPSDHDSFYRKKIPVLFMFTGTHKDYHRPSDTPDKINLEGIKKVVGFGEDCLNHFAKSPAPVYQKTTGGWEDPTEERRAARPAMPKMGIMPGNYESTDGGVLIEGLTDGGAAQKAGMKEKDVIIVIAGKPVKNIEDYMTAMAAQKPNVEIEVTVLRDGKKVTVKATPKP